MIKTIIYLAMIIMIAGVLAWYWDVWSALNMIRARIFLDAIIVVAAVWFMRWCYRVWRAIMILRGRRTLR